MTWNPELDELAKRTAMAHQMGGADKVKRQHDAGRLTVRERIDRLLDPASFHEDRIAEEYPAERGSSAPDAAAKAPRWRNRPD